MAQTRRDLDINATEAGVGLVRRLMTGRAETSYTCCSCGTVSRHLERMTDLHLALPDALTRSHELAKVSDRPGGSTICSRSI